MESKALMCRFWTLSEEWVSKIDYTLRWNCFAAAFWLIRDCIVCLCCLQVAARYYTRFNRSCRVNCVHSNILGASLQKINSLLFLYVNTLMLWCLRPDVILNLLSICGCFVILATFLSIIFMLSSCNFRISMKR